ncbi:MAG: GIY-YIG nuclease family protein [Flavobacteriales bacterium]|nr:GIY-YIG nuclease family protein [Flavobacteriales bacterium]
MSIADLLASVDKAHQKNELIMWKVYMVKCNDGTIYTGCTNNIDDRLNRHGKGEISYTRTRLPVDLITYIAFSNKYKAYEFEKYLKSGSGKAFANKRFL